MKSYYVTKKILLADSALDAITTESSHPVVEVYLLEDPKELMKGLTPAVGFTIGVPEEDPEE